MFREIYNLKKKILVIFGSPLIYPTHLYVPYRYSHSQQDEVVSSLTPRKYTVLNGNFVFDMHDFDLLDIFQECDPGIK
jgi:hypothetical protein